MLSDNEMDCLTSAFRSLETGLRGATINQEDIQAAMLMVGLNPSDQECVDIPNEFARLDLNLLTSSLWSGTISEKQQCNDLYL